MSEQLAEKAKTFNRVNNVWTSTLTMNKASGKATKINNISLMHQNFQSLRNKKYELEIMLNNELQDVDVLCCTEHWLKENEITSYQIENFQLASSFCRTTYNNGGTAIFVKQHLNYRENTQSYYLNLERIFEHVVVVTKISNFWLTIICIYRSPDGCMKTFLEHFEILLNTLKKKEKPVILCGDFNINFLSNDHNVSEFRSILQSHNLVETINSPTRITTMSQTCLDQIIIDYKSYPFRIDNINLGISDHNAILIHLQIGEIVNSNIHKKVNYKRTFNEENINYFKSLLQKENWNSVTDKIDVNDKSFEFIHIIKYYFDIAFPVKKFIVSQKRYKSQTWITKGIAISCQRKRELHKLCKITNDLNLKSHYKTYCSILRKVIYEAKMKCNREYITNAGNKNKAIWDIVRKETRPNSNTAKDEIEILYNGRLVKNSQEIAEMFNEFFANVTQIQISHTAHNQQLPFINRENDKTIFLPPTTPEELLKVINSLKNTLSCGIDDIPDKVVKRCAPLLIIPLLDISNSSITSGTFPQMFKVAKVCPILKKGDRQNVENYRPISLLSVFSKILEKIMYNRLISFLESNHVLSNSQYGFRKGKGIDNAIQSFTETILKAKDSREQTVGLFLDLSKAFDMVNHNILIDKLNKIGIRGLAENWFISYLSNRTQIVEINSAKSNPVLMGHGVPQGSILGPILFIIYINDLPLNLSHTETVLFADDTNIILNASNTKDLQTKINETTKTLEAWLTNNKLKLNENKTVYIHFNQYSLHDPIQIFLNHTIIKEVENTKFLGIWVDSTLSWECHIDNLAEKLNRLCYAFRILAKILPMEVLKSIYFGYVHSLLSYGIIIWGSSLKSEKILKLQKRILKIMKQVPIRTESKKIFSELQVLPLPCIYILESVCFIHQNMNLFPINSDFHEYNTRTSNNVHLSSHRLTRSLNSISHKGSNLFNHLPHSIKHLKNKQFKHSVKQILLKHMPLCTNEFLNVKL